jgi:hypothetical protein
LSQAKATLNLQRWSAIAILSVSLVGSVFALPLLPSQAKADVLAAQTWMPVFSPTQSVYLDNKIRNHAIAPFQFSADFSNHLATLGQESDLVYLVVAAQPGSEPLRKGAKLGTAKLDQLLPRWTIAPGFPKANYVVMFWVRRSDDPTKGSVGVNVGSKARALGITLESLSSADGLVTPALKANMPQDPEAALLAIAQNINDEIQTARDAQDPLRQRESQPLKQIAAEDSAKLPDNLFGVLLLLLVGGGASTLLVFRVRDRKVQKQRAASLMRRWKSVTENGATLYTELTENYFSQLEYISSLKLEGAFATQAEQARMSLANFIAHWTEAEKRVSQAESSLEQKKYGQLIQLLEQEPIKVTSEALPIKVATLLSGLTPTHEYSPEKLLTSMSKLYEEARDKTLKLIETYEGVAEFKDGRPQKIADAIARLKQKLELPFEYGLAVATPPAELPQKTYFNAAETTLFFYKIGQQTQLGAEAWSNNDLNQAIERYGSILRSLETREAQVDTVLDDKLKCDHLSSEVDSANRQFFEQLSVAEQSLKTVQVNYPSEDIRVHVQNLEQVNEAISWSEMQAQFQDIQPIYLASQFNTVHERLMAIMELLEGQTETLNNLIQLPETMASQQQVLNAQISRYRNHSSRFDAVAQGTDYDTLQNLLLMGQLSSVQSQLDSIRETQVAADSLVSVSSRGSESYSFSSDSSSYDSGSSSSSYDSSSSSSSYDSSSSSSDYGSSSGGGDY